MAKPVTVPTFATDALFPAGSEDWSGLANKVAPGAGLEATGLIPETEPGAEALNFLLGLTGDWLAWLNTTFDSSDFHQYPVSKTTVLKVSIGHFFTGDDWVIGYDGNIPEIHAGTIGDAALLDLNRLIPSNATITRIRVMVDKDVGGGGDAMTLNKLVTTMDFGTPAPSAVRTELDTDSVTTGLFSLDSGTVAIMLPGSPVLVEVTSANVAHKIYGAEITYTNNGLRNN